MEQRYDRRRKRPGEENANVDNYIDTSGWESASNLSAWLEYEELKAKKKKRKKKKKKKKKRKTMSDYHILQADEYGNSFGIVMHFPVPDTVNEAGINYRTAIVEWQGGAPIESALGNAIGSEGTQLDSGELYERSYTFHSNPNETPAQKQARLDQMWNDKKVEVQAELDKILSYWGFSRTIP